MVWRISPKYFIVTFEVHVKVLFLEDGAVIRGATVEPLVYCSCTFPVDQVSSAGVRYRDLQHRPQISPRCMGNWAIKPAELAGSPGTPS